MFRLRVFAIVAALVVSGFLVGYGGVSASPFSQTQDCTQLQSPTAIPGPGLINFDTLPNATIIGNNYAAAYGVRFEDARTNRAIIFGPDPAPHSAPNIASNNAVFPNTSSNVPMRITFDSPKTHVGFYMGNGETIQPTALLTAYNVGRRHHLPEALRQRARGAHRFLRHQRPEGRHRLCDAGLWRHGTERVHRRLVLRALRASAHLDSHGHADANVHADGYSHAHPDADADPNADRHSHGNGSVYADTDAHRHSHGDNSAHADADAYPDTGSDRDTDTDSHSGPSVRRGDSLQAGVAVRSGAVFH